VKDIPETLVVPLDDQDMPPNWCTIRTNDRVAAPKMETDGRLLEFYINLKPEYDYEAVLVNDGYSEAEDGPYLLDETGTPTVTLDEVQKLTDDSIVFHGNDGWRDRHETRLQEL
jgi:hypothetical protein